MPEWGKSMYDLVNKDQEQEYEVNGKQYMCPSDFYP
jgi:hypothetical protein